MGYMHIDNLYKNQDILLFKECFALEKIHGTSAHIIWNNDKLGFFSGGENHEKFVNLFDKALLTLRLEEAHLISRVFIYGEAYGGKQQGMSGTYGKALKFVGFDVKIGDTFLSVEQAEGFCVSKGIEFVHYKKVPTNIEALNAERDAPSVQANRNGVDGEHKREGIVLRPLIELTKNNGARIISKHKREDFQETKTPRPMDPEKLAVLADAEKIAEEWVTEMRLSHVLDKFPSGTGLEAMPNVIRAMVEDVEREATGEIIASKDARRAIGKHTANLFKARIKSVIAG